MDCEKPSFSGEMKELSVRLEALRVLSQHGGTQREGLPSWRFLAVRSAEEKQHPAPVLWVRFVNCLPVSWLNRNALISGVAGEKDDRELPHVSGG